VKLMPTGTLIVSEPTPGARDLCRIITNDGGLTRLRTPLAALRDGWPADGTPDVVLVEATIDIVMVQNILQRVAGNATHPPAVLSFTHRDVASLNLHIREGLDFLLPPFLPYLVKSRLATSRRHHELNHLVQEMGSAGNRDEYDLELKIGREIQRGFLPERLQQVDGWELAAHFQPAREVGGDFYDAYDVNNGTAVGLVIADVCGKGVGAALFMALIRSLLRQAAVAQHPERARIDGVGANRQSVARAAENLALHAVRTTNDYLIANHLQQAYFATLFLAVVDQRSGHCVYINGGHNPPILCRAAGGYARLMPTGPALGLMPDANFQLGHVTLDRGDLLLLYTDGVPEAKNAAGKFFGERRMRACLDHSFSARSAINHLVREVAAFAGAAEQSDDVTLLALRRAPAPRREARPGRW
jgi:phosphoserine phosphatase RsbU/P